ncbi:hypothetical protein GCM10010921_15130 [Microbacterium album]|uniref:Uncharacterized protein n=1 Tax=Microbacterium album TaxID=2053191 RepID=A0A917MNM2_9MICO|nr:hypothetical protein GCM10010921_15130 [Microbacterium album]
MTPTITAPLRAASAGAAEPIRSVLSNGWSVIYDPFPVPRPAEAPRPRGILNPTLTRLPCRIHDKRIGAAIPQLNVRGSRAWGVAVRRRSTPSSPAN